METLAIPYLLAVGALLSLQAAANVQLSTATASPVAASALQLGIGATILLAAAAVAGTLGAFGLLPDADPADLVGGLGSAVYITAGIVLFPRLGAVVTVGLFIAGQMLTSLALDGFGWLGVERSAPGAPKMLGAVAVVCGAALIVRAQLPGGAARPPGPARRGPGRASRHGGLAVGRASRDGGLALGRASRDGGLALGRASRHGGLALGLAAGAVLPIQGAVNAELRTELDAPITVAAFSFLVATAAMGIALAAVVALDRGARPRAEPLRRVPWWGWLGGLCGATYVTSVFLLIPEIGVAATVALTVAGQQVASLFVDRHGLFRLPRRAISPARLAGVGVLLAGVALIQIA
jgi:transporter family-2 protein